MGCVVAGERQRRITQEGQMYFLAWRPPDRRTSHALREVLYNLIPFSSLWKGEEQFLVRVMPKIPGGDFATLQEGGGSD